MSCCDTYHPLLGGDKIMAYSNSGHSVTENGKTFRLSSNGCNFCKIKVDGGLYREGIAPKKCDWIFILCGTEDKIYFIELKGSGTPIEAEPFDQITQTIQIVKRKVPNLKQRQIFGVVVGARMPGRHSPTWRKKQENFRRKFGNKLERKDPIYELPI